MKNKLLFGICILLILLVLPSVKSVIYYDSTGGWTSESASITGWQEAGASNWNLHNKSAITNSKYIGALSNASATAYSTFYKDQKAEFIYFRLQNITNLDTFTLYYSPSSSEKIAMGPKKTAGTLYFTSGGNSISWNESNTIKIETNTTDRTFKIWVDSAFYGRYAYYNDTVTAFRTSFTNGYGSVSSGAFVEWVCMDSTGTECIFNGTGGGGGGTASPTFNVFGKDYRDNQTISRLNLQLVNNSGVSEWYSTTNGTVKVAKENIYYNITTYSNDYYFNVTFYNVKVNSSLNITTYLTPYPNITVYNQQNLSKLGEFSAIIDGIKYYSGSNTFLMVPYNESKSVTINRSTYLDQTLTQDFRFSLNSNLNTTLHQSEIALYGYEVITNKQLNQFNVSFGNVLSHSGNSDFVRINVSAGTNLLKLNSKNHTNQSMSITTVGGSTYSYNWSIWESELVITATSIAGYPVNQFSAYGYAMNFTWLNYSNASINNVTYRLLYGYYNFSVDTDNTSSNPAIIVLNDSSELYDFTMYVTNSINFSFYDIETMLPIQNLSVTIELIGTYDSYNWTGLGSYFFTLVIPDHYTIRYSAPGYSESFQRFYLVNDTVNWVTFYLVNSSTSSDIVATVYDESSWPVENAEIRTLRYYQDTNSYLLHETMLTNFEGQAIAHLTLGTEFYKFLIYYNDELRLETKPTYIKLGTSEISFQINLEDPVLENYRETNNILYALTFNSLTDNFRYLYSDKTATISKACLNISAIDSYGYWSLVNSTCAATSSGILYAGVTNISNKMYKADAYVFYNMDKEKVWLASATYQYLEANVFARFGLFIVILVMIVFSMISIWNPFMSVIITPIPLVLGQYMGLINIGWPVVITVQIMGVVIGFLISKYT